jgi:RNA polymerase sigma-70 factor (ECF subfamily)
MIMEKNRDQKHREDSEIIKEILRGSGPAMNELIKKYQKRVYNTDYGMSLNYDTAWDISQEAFVKAVRALPSFRGDSSFWTFLCRIVINTFYDHKRKVKSPGYAANFSDYSDDEDKRMFEVRDVINIEEDFEKKELKDRLKSALSALTDAQRQVFILKNNEGLKIREIAGVLNISEGTVKSHLNRSVEKIKNELGGIL